MRNPCGQLSNRLQALHFQQRRLHPLTFRDLLFQCCVGRRDLVHPLLHRGHVACDSVDPVAVGHGGPGKPAPAAILVQNTVLRAADTLAGPQPFPYTVGMIEVIRVDQVPRRTSQHLLLGPAKDAREGGAHCQVVEITIENYEWILAHVPHPVAFNGALSDRPFQLRVAGLQGRLIGAKPIFVSLFTGDVVNHAHEARCVVLRVPHLAITGDPTFLASICAAYPKASEPDLAASLQSRRTRENLVIRVHLADNQVGCYPL